MKFFILAALFWVSACSNMPFQKSSVTGTVGSTKFIQIKKYVDTQGIHEVGFYECPEEQVCQSVFYYADNPLPASLPITKGDMGKIVAYYATNPYKESNNIILQFNCHIFPDMRDATTNILCISYDKMNQDINSVY